MDNFDYSKKEYTEEELLEIAKKRIKINRELISHIMAYIFVNGFLVFIYISTGGSFIGGYFWPGWVLAGWGLGLLFHISETIQELRFKYNTNAINKELEKIKKQIKND